MLEEGLEGYSVVGCNLLPLSYDVRNGLGYTVGSQVTQLSDFKGAMGEVFEETSLKGLGRGKSDL